MESENFGGLCQEIYFVGYSDSFDGFPDVALEYTPTRHIEVASRCVLVSLWTKMCALRTAV
jgi:hypothetical protein